MKFIKLNKLLFITLFLLCCKTGYAFASDKVHVVLFWSPTCPHCHDVIENILPPIEEKFKDKLSITYIMLYKESQAAPFYKLASEYGIERNDAGVPFMIIGDKVLIGTDQIEKEMPRLIQDGIKQGGIPFPEKVLHSEFAKYVDIKSTENGSFEGRPYTIFTALFLSIIALYSILSFKFKALIKFITFFETIRNYLIPIFIFIGFLISVYLFHLEITDSSGVCILFSGCNEVQRSSFSHLFGIIPLALLEMLLFVGLFVLWLYSYRFRNTMIFQISSKKILFWINFSAVVVAIYLTILEIFVIKAACVYCLISSIILSLLLILFNPELGSN